jgi:hypothetical protein
MNIIGRFYLLLTLTGNLLGEFSNNRVLTNFTESADWRDGDRNTFIGNYISTWREGNEAFIVDLSIDQLPGAINTFTLTWVGRAGSNICFWGEAFLVGDRLIGNYADFRLR